MTYFFNGKDILVFDIETDSLDTNTAKVKWFGAYSYKDNSYHLWQFDKTSKADIKNIIANHKVIVGFNNKEFDQVILQNNLNDDHLFDYKVIVDLLEVSAPKGVSYGQFRKNRLAQMGFKLKNFTLKNIIEALKLDEDGTKGDIDYKIFQKDSWSKEEVEEIKKYLKQDIDLTKKLLEWYHEQFAPLMRYLPKKDRDNLLYIKCSLATLAYNIICNMAGLKPEFAEKIKTEPYPGGHHILPRWDLVKGKIYSIDIVSAYPSAIIMGNLHSPVEDLGQDVWNGEDYYNIKGTYIKAEQGKVEKALETLLYERLRAKREGDKPKNLSYKIVINSTYGIFANPVFKSIYSRQGASDCTAIVRTWLKKLAKTLEVNGFKPLYGFTDSIYVLVPPHLDKRHMMIIVNKFVKEAKSHMPFDLDTFKLDIEEEIKMIWFVAKNCYLYVTSKDEIKYKSTLLNTNTPEAVMKLFKEYMTPVIIDKLEIPFTKEELEKELKMLIEKNPKLAAKEYKVSEIESYKNTTSLQYQISDKYGPGRHFLIPNTKGIGVGLAKATKKKIAVRHCSYEEFVDNNLTVDDIDIKHLMSHLDPFYKKNVVIDDQNNEAELITITGDES